MSIVARVSEAIPEKSRISLRSCGLHCAPSSARGGGPGWGLAAGHAVHVDRVFLPASGWRWSELGPNGYSRLIAVQQSFRPARQHSRLRFWRCGDERPHRDNPETKGDIDEIPC